MPDIGRNVARTWHPRMKNDGSLSDCTVLLGAGVARWSLRVKVRGGRGKGTLGMVIPLNAG